MRIPQSVKCLFGFHAWLPWRHAALGDHYPYKHRVCATCGKIQRGTR